jgi:hypothetical protein
MSGVNRFEKYTASSVAVLTVAAALGSAACGGKASPNCLSPRQKSDIYRGDPRAVQNLQSTWLTGIAAKTALPPHAEALIVGFKSPDSSEWSDSKPVDPSKAGIIGLRIGHEAVQFSTRIEAPASSVDCDTAPETSFYGPKPWGEITSQDVTTPEWPSH